MKHKETTKTEEVKLPALQIHWIWKKLIEWVSRVDYIYWVILIIISLATAFVLIPDNILNRFWLQIKAQKVLVSLVLVFSAVALSLIWKTGQRIDVWAFMFLNTRGNRPRWIDWTMLGATQIGHGIFAVIMAIVFYLRVDHLLAYEIILGTLTLWLVVELMKMLIRRRRPYINLKDIRIVGERAGGHSFPSGHTSQAFFLATLLFQHFNAGLFGGLILYSIAFLVGITRIYVGMHYPRDVIAGSVLGTAWGLLGAIVNSYIRH
ncbi:MAG: phosphatase PAP2 family protein [Acetivibrionales bacterium]|nr:phosphatase PAP2 family protein [Clostridiaceae bacterium]